MAIEAVAANPQVAPQIVNTQVGTSRPVAKGRSCSKATTQASASRLQRLHIDREPIISSTELEAKIVS